MMCREFEGENIKPQDADLVCRLRQARNIVQAALKDDEDDYPGSTAAVFTELCQQERTKKDRDALVGRLEADCRELTYRIESCKSRVDLDERVLRAQREEIEAGDARIAALHSRVRRLSVALVVAVAGLAWACFA
jgi:hypothetical protein